jgi:hypothetical protein
VGFKWLIMYGTFGTNDWENENKFGESFRQPVKSFNEFQCDPCKAGLIVPGSVAGTPWFSF